MACIFAAIAEFLNAKQIDDQTYAPEDEFLPRKKKKLSALFIFLPKNKPVRWHAYWMHRMIQIYLLAFVVAVVVWICISGSYDLLRVIILSYSVLMVSSDFLLRLGVFVYAKIKKAKQQKNRDK